MSIWETLSQEQQEAVEKYLRWRASIVLNMVFHPLADIDETLMGALERYAQADEEAQG